MNLKNCLTLFFIVVAIQIQYGVAIGYETARSDKLVRSAPVSLGNGDYVLVARDGRKLYLQHTVSNDTSKWEVVPTEVSKTDPNQILKNLDKPAKTQATSQDRWLSEEKHGRITQIALARWSRASLLAVVRVSRGKETSFWCLTFRHLARSLEEKKQLAPSAVVVTRGGPSDRVLALSGNVNSPAVTIVMGKLSRTRPGVIEHGTIAFEWCGYPEFANVGQFKPEYRGAK